MAREERFATDRTSACSSIHNVPHLVLFSVPFKREVAYCFEFSDYRSVCLSVCLSSVCLSVDCSVYQVLSPKYLFMLELPNLVQLLSLERCSLIFSRGQRSRSKCRSLYKWCPLIIFWSRCLRVAKFGTVVAVKKCTRVVWLKVNVKLQFFVQLCCLLRINWPFFSRVTKLRTVVALR